MSYICKNCRSPFRPHPKVPSQEYCSKKSCQNARKRQWQKEKLQNDGDYRKNQRAAQKTWCRKNPGYWKTFRENHPGYTERNRKMQRDRNAKTEGQMIAKMDDLVHQSNLIPGYYMLYPVRLVKIAKMDALLVKIDVITKG